MPAYNCPHCHQPFTAAAGESSTRVLCPHCQQSVEVLGTNASRWFLARNKKKHGPFTWKQLLTLAERGDVKPDDLLLQEGSKQWVRAEAVPNLFPAAPAKAASPKASASSSAAAVATAPAKSPTRSRRGIPWIFVSAGGAAVAVMLAVVATTAFFLLRGDPPDDPKLANQDRLKEDRKAKDDKDPAKKDSTDLPKKVTDPPTKKTSDAPKKDGKGDDKKKNPSPNPSVDELRDQKIAQFVERLNRYRKAAGLGVVALDAELSQGCLAHAKYLARHVEPGGAAASNVYDEDPKKPGYSVEGERAGAVAIVATLDPTMALERWMARVLSRVPLLNPEIQTIGVGAERTEAGAWYCVVDAVRGRAEPIVVYPWPKQTDVPISYSGGPELPEMAPAGFPISVLFPPGKKVTEAQIELRNAAGSPIDGVVFTPEKPAQPKQRINALALIPRTLFEGKAMYHVKASAQVEGKPWSLAWSFQTEDDTDRGGIWAKKALDRVNAYRASAGLMPVVLDDKLSQGCLKHARYLVINEGHKSLLGLNAHNEDLKLPGASVEGDAAGKASNIAIGDYEPIDAVDSWMATLYHRAPMLASNLKAIGFACARGRRQGWATVMNVQTAKDKSPMLSVVYPAPDQVGVPLTFPNSGEEPNPIPDDMDGRAGYPVTAFFPREAPLQNATGKLTNEKGDEIPCWFSRPEKPANPAHARAQGTAVCLIAREPLQPNTTYHVHMEGIQLGKGWLKKWKFTTRDAGLGAEAAARAVLDRINHYRTQAGLNAVALDDASSRGCQLHAEFLAKNADALAKAKAPVNDEDPTLPWYTAEGRRAARQSLVFTNAPTPVMQIDDLIGTVTARLFVLDPHLQRVGIGSAHDVGRGWRCVFDPNTGKGDSHILLFPAPMQDDVPLIGFDRIPGGYDRIGFPVTVFFPQRSDVRKAEALLVDAEKKPVDIWVSSPEKPLNEKLQRTSVGVHPLLPLRPGHTYTVTVAALINGKEWRQSWQFTTAK